jgi:uncharacterized protein
VSALEGLRSAIAEMPAIDHHAHLLVGPEIECRLAEVLTESVDPTQIDAGREHPAHQAGLRLLAETLGVEATEAAIAAARREGFAEHVRRLVDACRLEAMFVDDGFRPAGALALDVQAGLVGCPVRRVVRIETEAEAASEGWPPLGECRAGLQQRIAEAMAAGAVGLKTIAAYRCGLDLPTPSVEAASHAYDAWRGSASSSPRLQDPALVALFLADALEAAGDNVPVQVHTGLGDADQRLLKADPALLQEHIDHGLLAGRPVVLLHCYPFVRQAGYLASVYGHVHFDLSLAVTLLPHRAPELMAEALELAPPTKLLFATDASRLAEMFLLGTRWWRESLARALARFVDDDFVDEPRARRWAELILAGNARRLYRVTGA